MQTRLKQELILIKPSDKAIFQKTKDRWNNIAKPLGSLGKFEEMFCKLAAINGTSDFSIKKKCAVIFCADNGVCAQNVSQTDESITTLVAGNLAKNISSVNILGKTSNVTVFPVNVGMKQSIDAQGVIDRKIMCGTNDISVGPAMNRNECIQAILVGIDMAAYAKDEGFDIIASGEMGIGNTTTSSAIASVLLDVDPSVVTGRGAGLSKEGVIHKSEVIRKAIEINRPDRMDAIDIISKIGGLDIAAMTGLFLGGAIHHIPVVIDGLISTVSAILAKMIDENVCDYMIASHMGAETACEKLSKMLGISPVIYGDLALGEGTGAVLLFPLIDAVWQMYGDNITFEDIHMDAYVPL